jgi:hypothetical protein
MGCLTFPFKVIGCLGLVVLLALGWLYRDRVLSEAERLLGRAPAATAPGVTGRPGAQALRSARGKVAAMAGGEADSVVLTASEAASLLTSGLDPALRRQLDSVRIGLGDGAVTLDALLNTARLPKELVGPMAVALRPWERVRAAGPVRVVVPGEAVWEIRQLRVRDFPFPKDVVPGVMGRALGDTARHAVPIHLPRGVRDARITPRGVTLFRTVHRFVHRTAAGASRP